MKIPNTTIYILIAIFIVTLLSVLIVPLVKESQRRVQERKLIKTECQQQTYGEDCCDSCKKLGYDFVYYSRGKNGVFAKLPEKCICKKGEDVKQIY
jgi:hypothetical protein